MSAISRPLEQVFQVRGSPNFASIIFEYLDAPTVARVCKVFRRLMSDQLVKVGEGVSGNEHVLMQRTRLPDSLRSIEGRKALLQMLFQEVTDRMRKVRFPPHAGAPPNLLRTPEVRDAFSRRAAWGIFSQKVQRHLSEKELNLRQATRIYQSLLQINGVLEEFERVATADEFAQPGDEPLTDEEIGLLFSIRDKEIQKRILDNLDQALIMSNVEEALAQRFTETLAAQKPAVLLLNSANISTCLAGLHRAQTELVNRYSGDRRFVDISTSRKGEFSIERFIEQEVLAQKAQEIRDYDYESLWEAINRQFQQLGVNIGDNDPTTSLEIKEWLKEE